MAPAGHQSKDEALNVAFPGRLPRLLRHAVQAAIVVTKNQKRRRLTNETFGGSCSEVLGPASPTIKISKCVIDLTVTAERRSALQALLKLVTSTGVQRFFPGQINRDRLDLVL